MVVGRLLGPTLWTAGWMAATVTAVFVQSGGLGGMAAAAAAVAVAEAGRRSLGQEWAPLRFLQPAVAAGAAALPVVQPAIRAGQTAIFVLRLLAALGAGSGWAILLGKLAVTVERIAQDAATDLDDSVERRRKIQLIAVAAVLLALALVCGWLFLADGPTWSWAALAVTSAAMLYALIAAAGSVVDASALALLCTGALAGAQSATATAAITAGGIACLAVFGTGWRAVDSTVLPSAVSLWLMCCVAIALGLLAPAADYSEAALLAGTSIVAYANFVRARSGAVEQTDCTSLAALLAGGANDDDDGDDGDDDSE